MANALPYETTAFLSDTALCTADRYVATAPLAAADDCEKSYFVTSASSPRSIALTDNDINVILKGHNDERRAVFPYAS